MSLYTRILQGEIDRLLSRLETDRASLSSDEHSAIVMRLFDRYGALDRHQNPDAYR